MEAPLVVAWPNPCHRRHNTATNIPRQSQTLQHDLVTKEHAQTFPNPVARPRFVRSCSQSDQEAEGRVSYPKPYTLAAAATPAQDDGDEGLVSYPQVRRSLTALHVGGSVCDSISNHSARLHGQRHGHAAHSSSSCSPPVIGQTGGSTAAASSESRRHADTFFFL